MPYFLEIRVNNLKGGMQNRRNAEQEGWNTKGSWTGGIQDRGMGCRKIGIQDMWDAGHVGCRTLRTVGKQERRDSGLDGYKKGGFWDTGNDGFRKGSFHQDRRDAEQERCWTGGMQDRRDT